MAGTAIQRARRASAASRNPGLPPRDVTSRVLGPGPADEDMTGKRLPERPQGSVFEWGEGMFLDPESGVWWDRNEFAARDMNEAIRVDARLKVLEFALGEPIRRATWKLKPHDQDSGEAEQTEEQLRRKRWEGGMLTPVQQVLGQMTTAIYLRRAHFAKGLKLDPNAPPESGTVMWSQLAYRPASTCRLLRDPKTGALAGFEQDLQDYSLSGARKWDGQPVKFPLRKALIYVHGTHRDPVAGLSDLEVAYWCWKTKQKMIYLWMRYLEGVALPRTIVKHQGDDERAMSVAKKIAGMGSSGTAAIDGQTMELDVLDLSGKGPSPFTDGIRYFDLAASVSVRATFVELGSQAAGSSGGARGSQGMYKGMVDDFMQGRESVASEIAEAMTEHVVAPLVRLNYAQGRCPDFTFDPLAGVDEQPILDLLKQVAAVPQTALPPEFVSEIILEAARILQLDQDKIKAAVEKSQQLAEQAAEQQGQGQLGQQVAGVHAAISKIGKIAQGVTEARAKGQQTA